MGPNFLTLPETEREREIKRSRSNEIVLSPPRNASTHGLQGAGPKRTRRWSISPGLGAAELRTGLPRLLALPP